MTARVVQLESASGRRVALVDEPRLRLLRRASVYDLVQVAFESNQPLGEVIAADETDEVLAYDDIFAGHSGWRLLTPMDHPREPARLLVSGTGLTHLGSAKDRNAMHEAKESELTDSMKMFRWGLERGRPPAGQAGVAPEWFYKGNGTILRAPGEALVVPPYGEDGGEEAEIAGVYVVAPDGRPCRVGMCVGNEFSDHKFEKNNYLNLAGSKIRTCAIGPELVINPEFDSVPGRVALERGGAEFWSKDIRTGEAEMCHSLQNIEHHHFKFETHRRPGDVHVHYFGACSISFGAGVQLKDGDVMRVQFEGFGRPLCNPMRVAPGPAGLVAVRPI